MAYLETIESARTWICPKSGYYQVICVGGGGGGGGMGFHSLGALVTNPDTISASNTNIKDKFAFPSQSGGFISSTSKGYNGISGGSTSFGSLLTARGGVGGDGGGGELGSSLAKSLHPNGGYSDYVMGAGGRGTSISSISNDVALSSTYPNAYGKDTHLMHHYPENEPFIGSVAQGAVLNVADGILSVVSGGGGSSGEVKTEVMYITKGTEVACTIGSGGSFGESGTYSLNTSVSITLNTSGTNVGISILKLCDSRHIFLFADILGGGGGGGFTFEHTGGNGSDSISESFIEGINNLPYNFCNMFKSKCLPSSGNGGFHTSGIGYGAGGVGSGFRGLITAGLTPDNSNKSVNPETTKTLNINITEGALGGDLDNPIKFTLPDFALSYPAENGRDGVIVIREVS